MSDVNVFPVGEEEVPASPRSLINLSVLTRHLLAAIRPHYPPEHKLHNREGDNFDIVYTSGQEYLGDLNGRKGNFYTYPHIDNAEERQHMFELGYDTNWNLMIDDYPNVGGGVLIDFRRGGTVETGDVIETTVIVRDEGSALVQLTTNAGERTSWIPRRKINPPSVLSENGAVALLQDIAGLTLAFTDYEQRYPGFIVNPYQD